MRLIREVAEKVHRPFKIKLEETHGIIRHHLEEFDPKRLAVGWSGGKDSTLVLYLVRQLYPDITVFFCDTGVEWPETYDFIDQVAKAWNLNMVISHPSKTFWQCVDQYGFPRFRATGKKAATPRCCYWLKEKPLLQAIRANGWLGQFDGISAVESRTRMFAARRDGPCHHVKTFGICRIRPILWWTEEEVWEFTRANSIPANALYGKGAHRVGCMPCTGYIGWEGQMAKLNPRLYRLVKLRKDKQYSFRL